MRFRNVDVDLQSPVASWPLEALASALERGDLETYRRIAEAIQRAPWGPVAQRVEQALTWTQPYGVTTIMRRAIDSAREQHRRSERAWVVEQLRTAIGESGMSQSQFARALGTSPSRLSSYLNGRVTPAATLLARAKSIAQQS